jgi:hypothetical protein
MLTKHVHTSFGVQLSFPELYSFIKKQNLSLQEMMQANVTDLFHLPLSEQSYDQLTQLQDILQTLNISENTDQSTYIWGTGHYSAAKAYKQMIGHTNLHSAYGWLWKS